MKIINKINNTHVPKWGNQKKYIAIHYLGVDGQNNKVDAGGYGAHFYIYWDGTTLPGSRSGCDSLAGRNWRLLRSKASTSKK